MATYRVGQLYHPGVRQWPETGQLRITPDGVQLALFMAAIADWEIAELRTGTAEFAWVDGEHAAILAYRFGGAQRAWSDCPYHPGRDPGAGLPAGAGGDGTHLLVHVVLVDADTGLIVAMRQVTWPPGFARRVAETVERMLAGGYNARAHDNALDAIYGRYTNSDLLVAQRADIVCVGGADQG